METMSQIICRKQPRIMRNLLRVAAVASFLFATPSYAADYYTVAGSGGSATITEHTVCRIITNNNAVPVHVPTKSASEWHTGGSSFLENLPANVTAGSCDVIPDAFDFVDETNATSGQSYTDSVVVSGFGGSLTASVFGTADAQISNNGSVWGTTASIANGGTIYVRMNASTTLGTSKQLVVTLGDKSANWKVTTSCEEPPDTVPDAFSFTDVTGAAVSTVTTSNSITISGITGATAVSATNGATFSINGGAYGTSGTISNGQTLRIRLTSSAIPSTVVSTTVTVGGVTDSWSVTTTGGALVQEFNTPGAYTWYKPSVAADYLTQVQCWGAGGGGGRNSGSDEGDGGGGGGYGTVVYTIASLPNSVTGAVGAGGLGRATNGNGTAGGQSSFGAYLYANGGGGGVGGSGQGAGGTFSGTSVTGEVGGLGGWSDNAGQSRTWAGGGGAGGANSGSQWGGTSTYGGKGGDGDGDNGYAGAQPGGGGGGAQGGSSGNGGHGKCVVTTFQADTTPNAFAFTDVTGQTMNAQITSNSITISGINMPAAVTATNGATFSINGGAYGTSGNISNGQTLSVRMTSSGSPTTAVTTTVTVGGVSDVWSVTTGVAGASCSAQSKTLVRFTQECTASIGAASYSCTAAADGMAATCTRSGYPTAYAKCIDGTLYQVGIPYTTNSCNSGSGDNDEARDDLIWSFGKERLQNIMDRSLRDGKLH
jgi:hypothetical protein